MKSKMTKSKCYGKQTTSTKKNSSNYEQNNTKNTINNLWPLLIILFIGIGIFLSIKESNDRYSSTHFQQNKEKFEQATEAAKSYWRFAELYRDDIIDELIYEGFTYDQAVYGLQENDY